MLTKPFLIAKPILEQIEKHDHQAYFVGGCVRDLLLERPIGDIDITTSATPALIQKIFPKVIPVGIEHGTVIVRHEHQSFEVTTFRIDGDYLDNRHPDSVTFIDNIDKDLERRDFTINALAMNIDGDILDLFSGKSDLQDRMIRTVGNGNERFTEDPLRIIRALRFSSQLGFTIHPDTFKAMIHVKEEIESLAMERITTEFTKFFAGEFLANGIRYLQSTGIEEHLPILRDQPGIITSIPESLLPLQSFGEVVALFHTLQPDVSVSTWTREWKCSNKIKLEALQLVESMRYFLKNGLDPLLVYQLDKDYYHGFTRLANCIQPDSVQLEQLIKLHKELPIQSKRELAINGNDLIELFPSKPKGHWLQVLLTKIEEEVLLGKLKNTKKDIKEWIKWNPPEID